MKPTREEEKPDRGNKRTEKKGEKKHRTSVEGRPPFPSSWWQWNFTFSSCSFIKGTLSGQTGGISVTDLPVHKLFSLLFQSFHHFLLLLLLLAPPSFNHGINYSFPLLVSSNKKGEKLKMGRKKRNDDDEARRFQMTFAGLIFRPFIGNKMIRTASAANRKSYCAVTLTKNVSLEADCIAPLSVWQIDVLEQMSCW